MKEYERNPWPAFGKWFFYDEEGETHGPYDYQLEAVRAMCDYIDPPMVTRCLNWISRTFLKSPKKIDGRPGRECP